MNVPQTRCSRRTATRLRREPHLDEQGPQVQLGVVGRNLGDKRYKVAGYPFGGFFNTITTFYGDPRTVKFVGSVTF